MPLTNRLLPAFLAVFTFFQPVFGQNELEPLLRNLSLEEKKSLAEFILSENPDSLDRRLETLFHSLSDPQKRRAIDLVFDQKEIANQPIRTRAELAQDTVDFGVLTRGDRISVKTEVHNRGEKPYLISKIISPCGCLAAFGPTMMIAPGEKADIQITLDTENTARGQLLQTLVLKDNSSPNQRLFIVVRANIL